ncbi:hypothetical protein GOV12_05780 [Candidatus Pacearchaeota archaeon]|nr:hypothetical protein [Candidatus Pacearchaeota archaeon]
MKITITGSMKFYSQFQELKKQLEKLNHQVIIPLPDEHYDNSNQTKKQAMIDFNKNLEDSNAILVANYKKNNQPNYIGINSIMEIGMAFNKNKKIFILNQIPDNCKDELIAIEAIELNHDLNQLK